MLEPITISATTSDARRRQASDAIAETGDDDVLDGRAARRC